MIFWVNEVVFLSGGKRVFYVLERGLSFWIGIKVIVFFGRGRKSRGLVS